MFQSNAAVRRPVAICCLIIALFLLGANAYRQMNLELLPRMDVPYITVVTVYPGASPRDIEVDVAKRIEDAVGLVDGLKHVTSTCMENVVQTLLEFNLGVDVNVAANDVREKIDRELANFPSGVEKPVVMKYDVNARPIATFTLTGDLPSMVFTITRTTTCGTVCRSSRSCISCSPKKQREKQTRNKLKLGRGGRGETLFKGSPPDSAFIFLKAINNRRQRL